MSCLQWRDKLDQYAKLKSEGTVTKEEGQVEEVEAEEDGGEEDEEKKLDDAIAELKDAELREGKRKKKKLLKERRKIHDKTNLKMIIPGDIGPTDTSEDSLFTLKSIRTSEDVENLTDRAVLPEVPQDKELTFEEELEIYEEKRRAKRVSFNKEEEVLDDSGRYYRKIDEITAKRKEESSDDEDEEPDLDQGLALNGKAREIDSDEHEEEDDDEDRNEEMDFDEVAPIHDHPLITDLDHSDKNQKRLRKAQMWFDKVSRYFRFHQSVVIKAHLWLLFWILQPAFQGLDDESDEDLELDRLAESVVQKGGTIIGYEPKAEQLKAKSESKSNGKDVKKESKKRKVAEDDDDCEFDGEEPLDDDFDDAPPRVKKSSELYNSSK